MAQIDTVNQQFICFFDEDYYKASKVSLALRRRQERKPKNGRMEEWKKN